ncbi:MAG: acetoacetate--CoA ligase [Ardenticatenaceae bacterium]|nr:acetoacetate--CoA ligase [Ardenticatenaceae bacterium]MCB9003884.1 acetoacetate--CoA ligase [Ardenticatenaceae bacterium]
MTDISEGSLLWRPSPKVIENANLTHYMHWLADQRGLTFGSYGDLWDWSVTQVADFWQSLWDYFGVTASQTAVTPLSNSAMPGAAWFPGARLNYAENFFARMWHGRPAIYAQNEDQPLREIGWEEIREKTAVLAQHLRSIGVQPGDRVVAYMPHIPETIIALFAAASVGAVWSSCSPDFGSRSVLDRFQQIEPTVLLAVDGYTYGGKRFDRRETIAELQEGLPTLRETILVSLLGDGDLRELDAIVWDDLLAQTDVSADLTFEQLPFDHPLWVLYSSGTTGRPKPIVQSHGGILLEHLKMAVLHLDLQPDDRFFWYTSTGWMMWNFLIGGLLAGASIVVYNGSPGYPDTNALWALAAQTGMTYFGTSAAFVSACMKAGIQPNRDFDLRAIRAVGSTGSPLTVDNFVWVYEHVNADLALESVSGGTDLCTAFVGGCRLLPIFAGEIQGACLGAKVQAFNDAGEAVVDEVGELVITQPMPSMPLYFWNDADNVRYRDSYFDMFPGVWRHGDWIKFTERGGCVIYGRSDSTINRQGIRMGTSEIYQAVESLDEVLDSLVIDLELLGRESYMPLFVVLREGVTLDADLQRRIKQKIRADISPRHVPNEIFAIEQIPYTLSGKKMEVPVRRILLGQDVNKAANPGAMRNPQAIGYFVEMAKRLGEL